MNWSKNMCIMILPLECIDISLPIDYHYVIVEILLLLYFRSYFGLCQSNMLILKHIVQSSQCIVRFGKAKIVSVLAFLYYIIMDSYRYKGRSNFCRLAWNLIFLWHVDLLQLTTSHHKALCAFTTKWWNFWAKICQYIKQIINIIERKT